MSEYRKNSKTNDEFLESSVESIGTQASFLTEDEWQKLLVDFNQSRVSYPTDKTLVQLFEAQVAKTPEAVAIQYGQDYLTYELLNRRANQLAHFL